MKIVTISQALKRLKKLNNEIRYADCFSEKQFTSGLIAFRRNNAIDPKQIEHADKLTRLIDGAVKSDHHDDPRKTDETPE